jgi:hypothetical protein
MPVYLVDSEKVSLKPVKTTEDFADLLRCGPMDLDELESDLMTLDQQPVPIIHHFAPGVYMREARLPAGCLILGHKQTKPHLDVMLTGRVSMDNGMEIKAPMTFTGTPGRKCGVIHEDTVWLNIYATDEQDIGTLESMFMEKSEAAINQEKMQACRITDDVLAARLDFDKMLVDLSVSRDQVETMSHYMEDRIRLPWGAYRFRTALSPIHGQGVFASAEIKAGELIGPANVTGKRTVLGWGVNHSGKPNSKMVPTAYGIALIAHRDILGNRGGLFGDEITVDYRESRKVALCLAQ